MTVRLRPHHLLCVLTYVGKGYTTAFVREFDAAVARLRDGESVVVVAGPDDLCAAMLDEPQCHCRNASVAGRDRAATADLGGLLGHPLPIGLQLVLDVALIERLRAAFAADTIRSACRDCLWDGLCTGVAQEGFRGVRLAGGAEAAP